MKKFISILILLLLLKSSYSQIFQKYFENNFYLSPFITLGYTFGSGVNFGIDITAGIIELKNYYPEISGGISFQYYLVNYEKSMHVIKNITFVAESKYFRLGYGIGVIKKNWGFRDRNISKAYGTGFDWGISAFSTKVPWIGIKTFIPFNGTWEWCESRNYFSTYTYFKQEPVYLFQQ